ncbi:hypothetical protein SLEP1_g22923 [Rubroshorea leprosula]|uniref:Transposase n=1 Tax=Rubroshorea leprosula TaxID=152421 RepID=A0AAV5JMS4_9ROSI|nr:hypothetical protein SLEP1_g22923 [Rubroshorea leprosula]
MGLGTVFERSVASYVEGIHNHVRQQHKRSSSMI